MKQATMQFKDWELRHIIDCVSHRRRSEESRLAKQTANGTVYQPENGRRNIHVAKVTDLTNIEARLKTALAEAT